MECWAAKKGNRFLLLLGCGFLALSFLGILLARSFWMLFLSLGVLFALGAGGLAFGLILTSAIYFVGKKWSMIIAGMLNAASGMCGFFLSPAIQGLLGLGGLALTMKALLLPVAILVPVAFFVTSRDPAPAGKDQPGAVSFRSMAAAFHSRTFLLLAAGFTTCGFHMIIIETHLFSQYVSYGIPRGEASWAFSVYGLATITGALLSGYLSTRMKKKNLLAFYYGFRAVWTLVYLFLLPKTLLTAVLFAIGVGMTGDATVSPTSGIVGDHFRMEQVAALLGTLFLFHQIGAFASAWLGGFLLQLTGGYNAIWCIDVGWCTFAAVVSFLIGRGEREAA